MSRYYYYLHRYGDDSRTFANFHNRKSLSAYMRALPYLPSELADKFFLHVIAPKYSAIYNFKVHDGGHLVAVLSHRTNF